MKTIHTQQDIFDILFADFFNKSFNFTPLVDHSVPHPVDVSTTKDGLFFEIACTGIPKEHITVTTEDSVLRIEYKKPKSETEDSPKYLYQGLKKGSFNLGWKITSKYDLKKVKASFTNGLLQITVPLAKSAEPKTITVE